MTSAGSANVVLVSWIWTLQCIDVDVSGRRKHMYLVAWESWHTREGARSTLLTPISFSSTFGNWESATMHVYVHPLEGSRPSNNLRMSGGRRNTIMQAATY